ncbi:hypothetical protein F1737_09010 [Methanoplanus sp. FWC-SCC4]|uniref:Uncharacterized protein n=1 Tax=Methanochimaera problematica TaxID=2609417 RepID=A0AA97FEM3_9EURY|nr:hypothetical protein [Methanoplanus sp. FWC-SCC4]WOF16819.1 hypothetical protein F1737_09010 [Methanoplanus sp. FWC-SCC4]
MKSTSSILLLTLLFSMILCPAAMAAEDDIKITFTDLDFNKNTEIIVYDGTGELIKETNTSGTISLNSSYSYLFVFKPSEQTWFQNPLNSLEFLSVQMPTYIAYALWFAVILGSIVIVGRIFKVW